MSTHRQARSGLKGFTLIEVLVAMAVLALLLVLVTQLLNSASRAIGGAGKHLDSDTEARLLFNRMAVDFGRCVKRPDVDYSSFKQPAGKLGTQYSSTSVAANLYAGVNDEMGFYCNTDGYFSGSPTPAGSQKAPLSLIAYMVANDPYSGLPGLQRLGKGLGWEPDGAAWGSVVYLPLTLIGQWPNLFITSNNSPVDKDYKTVGSQVVRFEYTYLLKATPSHVARLSTTPWDTLASHTSINGFADVAAIVVAIVVLDSTSRVLVRSYTNLTTSRFFADAKDSTVDTTDNGDIAAAWNAALNSTATPAATTLGIPEPAAAALRVYERYFYLDTPQP